MLDNLKTLLAGLFFAFLFGVFTWGWINCVLLSYQRLGGAVAGGVAVGLAWFYSFAGSGQRRNRHGIPICFRIQLRCGYR